MLPCFPSSDGTELARYDFGGASLRGASVNRRTTALLLSTHSGNELLVLNGDLQVVGQGDAGQAEGVACADTAVYLWSVDSVSCHELERCPALDPGTGYPPPGHPHRQPAPAFYCRPCGSAQRFHLNIQIVIISRGKTK